MHPMFTAKIESRTRQEGDMPRLVRHICFHVDNYTDSKQALANRMAENARFAATVEILDPSNYSPTHNIEIVLTDTLQRHTIIAKKVGNFVENLMMADPEMDDNAIKEKLAQIKNRFELEAWQESRKAGDTWLKDNDEALKKLQDKKFGKKVVIIRWDDLILENPDDTNRYMGINISDDIAVAAFTSPKIQIKIPPEDSTRLENEYRRRNGFYNAVGNAATVVATELMLKKGFPYSETYSGPYLRAFLQEEVAAGYVRCDRMEGRVEILEELTRSPTITKAIKGMIKWVLKDTKIDQVNLEFNQIKAQKLKHRSAEFSKTKFALPANSSHSGGSGNNSNSNSGSGNEEEATHKILPKQTSPASPQKSNDQVTPPETILAPRPPSPPQHGTNSSLLFNTAAYMLMLKETGQQKELDELLGRTRSSSISESNTASKTYEHEATPRKK